MMLRTLHGVTRSAGRTPAVFPQDAEPTRAASPPAPRPMSRTVVMSGRTRAGERAAGRHAGWGGRCPTRYRHLHDLTPTPENRGATRTLATHTVPLCPEGGTARPGETLPHERTADARTYGPTHHRGVPHHPRRHALGTVAPRRTVPTHPVATTHAWFTALSGKLRFWPLPGVRAHGRHPGRPSRFQRGHGVRIAPCRGHWGWPVGRDPLSRRF